MDFCLTAHTVCTDFRLTAHAVCTDFRLNAHTSHSVQIYSWPPMFKRFWRSMYIKKAHKGVRWKRAPNADGGSQVGRSDLLPPASDNTIQISSGVFFLFSFKMTSLTSSSLKAYKEELGHFLDVVQGFTECQVWNWRWINIMCWSSGDCSNGVRCSKDLRRLCWVCQDWEGC